MIAGLSNKRKVELILYLILAFFLFGYLRICFERMTDFKVTHRTAVRVLEKEEIYDFKDGHYLFKYSPFFATLFSFLGFFPLSYAKIFWMFFLGFCVLGIARIGKYLVLNHRSPPPFFYLLSFVLVGKFILREIELGQTDFLQLFSIFTFLYLLEKNKNHLSGFFLGFSVMIKPTPLVFVPYLLYRKRFSVLLFAFLSILVLLFVPAIFFGFDHNLILHKKWYQILASSSPVLLASEANQSVFGLFYRFFVSPEHLAFKEYKVSLLSLSPFLVKILVYGFVLGSYIFLLHLNKLSKNVKDFLTYNKEALEYSLLLVFMSLFSPLGWIQNFSSLILACMILTFYTLKTNFRDGWMNIVLVLSFVLVNVINYETVGKDLNLLSQYLSFITLGTILFVVGLSKLRISGET